MERRAIAGNTATGWLKLLALVFMFADHAGKMLLPHVPEMRMIGRLAFPLYCWCMVVGAHYTRSMPKYLLRILLVGIVSQPLYMLALDHTWTEPNIFFTLFVALIGLWGLKEKKYFSCLWAPVLSLGLAVVLKCDYGWKGVLLILLLWGVRDTRAGIVAVMVAFCLYWGSTSGTISVIFGWRIYWPKGIATLLSPWTKLQALAIFALPMMLMPIKRNLKLPTWVGYSLYPAHLAVLYALEVLL